MEELTLFGQFAKAAREAFTPAWWEPGAALAVMGGLTIMLIYILYTWLIEQTPPPRRRGREYTQFAQICNAKGLESFDEQLLLELADISRITPIYRILLDQTLYDKAMKTIERRDWKKGEPMPPKIEYLHKLQRRLFF